MVIEMKDKYERIKTSGHILLNYNYILQICPNYKEIKDKIKEKKFPSIDEVINNPNYQNNKLDYDNYKELFEDIKIKCIKLCELIEYIGTYQSQNSRKEDLEELLKEYNITIKYYNFDDMDDMQIKAKDIVKVLDELEESINILESIEVMLYSNELLIEDTKKILRKRIENSWK